MEAINQSSVDSGFAANLIVRGGKLYGFDFHSAKGEPITKENFRRMMGKALEAVDETIDGMTEE